MNKLLFSSRLVALFLLDWPRGSQFGSLAFHVFIFRKKRKICGNSQRKEEKKTMQKKIKSDNENWEMK